MAKREIGATRGRLTGILLLLLLCAASVLGYYVYLRTTALRLDDSALFETCLLWNGAYYVGFLVDAVPERFADWTYVGDVAGVSQEKPDDELMMRADFPVSGEVYANSDCPEVLYGRLVFGERTLPAWVQMKTRRFWFKSYAYVDGVLYTVQPNVYLPSLTDLPAGYGYWGELKQGNKDRVPDEDCVTNDRTLAMEDCAVWVNEKEPGVIYLRSRQEGSEGHYIPAYNAKLWKTKNNAPAK